jgi:hypothetical protein
MTTRQLSPPRYPTLEELLLRFKDVARAFPADRDLRAEYRTGDRPPCACGWWERFDRPALGLSFCVRCGAATPLLGAWQFAPRREGVA